MSKKTEFTAENKSLKEKKRMYQGDTPREVDDYYATEPQMLRDLLKVLNVSKNVLEPSCGEGHLSEVLEENGCDVRSSDIVNRGFPGTFTEDFLERTRPFNGDIITNPPFKHAEEFIHKGLELLSTDSAQLILLLPLGFLQGINRYNTLFSRYITKPETVYVLSRRMKCAINGDFKGTGNPTTPYAWFVWSGRSCIDTKLKWIEPCDKKECL